MRKFGIFIFDIKNVKSNYMNDLYNAQDYLYYAQDYYVRFLKTDLN